MGFDRLDLFCFLLTVATVATRWGSLVRMRYFPKWPSSRGMVIGGFTLWNSPDIFTLWYIEIGIFIDIYWYIMGNNISGNIEIGNIQHNGNNIPLVLNTLIINNIPTLWETILWNSH